VVPLDNNANCGDVAANRPAPGEPEGRGIRMLRIQMAVAAMAAVAMALLNSSYIVGP
jgi:hypothetical protein